MYGYACGDHRTTCEVGSLLLPLHGFRRANSCFRPAWQVVYPLTSCGISPGLIYLFIYLYIILFCHSLDFADCISVVSFNMFTFPSVLHILCKSEVECRVCSDSGLRYFVLFEARCHVTQTGFSLSR